MLVIPASFQPQRAATAHKLALKTTRPTRSRGRTRVSAKVLHHRASARTYKTAGATPARRRTVN